MTGNRRSIAAQPASRRFFVWTARLFGAAVFIEDLVRQYGYLAVALGAFAEGETVLLFAGYAAQRGWLEWPLVVAVAALAATLGDQFFYFLGRAYGPRILRRFPRLQAHLPRVHAMLHRHSHWAIISVRFLYGLRIAGPVLIGVAGVAPWRFIVFNAIGALLWAPLITALGWFFGTAMAQVAARLQTGQEVLLALVFAVAAGAWLVRRLRRR